MKKLLVLGLVLLVAAGLSVTAVSAGVGNSVPSGKHYNLNLIGMSKEKVNMDDSDYNNGHVIFIQLGKNGMVKTRILLEEADDFNVIDRDGTDGTARFALPANNYWDPVTETFNEACNYRVYIRVLGNPSGSGEMYSGFIDEFGNEWFSVETITLDPHSKKGFDDVTKELTTVYYDADITEVVDMVRVNLFADALAQYFWDVDNNGVKLIQLRFYEDVPV